MRFSYKLGRKPALHNLKLPLFSSYTVNLPAAPASCNWTTNCTFQMFDNDTLGDCTAAALANQEIAWNTTCGRQSTVTEKQVVQFYSATTGYTAADPSTDQGGTESTILEQWLKTPGLLGGYNLAAFAAFNPTNLNSLRDSIWLTGGAYLGLNLPETIGETPGSLWQVPAGGAVGPGAPGSLGGHAVCALGYDSRTVYFASWGAIYQMTFDFFTTYCEECYALVSQDFINASHITPSGFDIATLQADIQALAA